ncbi:DUF6573 family protein [Acinetobacter lwoffii]|uniref:DUF6573 family protein n=1 Tax=Acinetobacter lwoffii TaxID=28090 RepID=UPI003437E2D9
MEQYISIYTRQQAIEDGFLVAINSLSPKLDQLAKEHYKHPICFTSALWAVIDKAVKNEKWLNDLEGVIHDILWMSRAYKKPLSPSAVRFTVIITGAGRKRNHILDLHVHGGDQGEPVITIGYPEDF